MRLSARCAALVVALAVAGCQPSVRPAPAPAPADSSARAAQNTFWAGLQSLCGRAYRGQLTEGNASDSTLRRAELVMHVRSCSAGEIRIPFHAGADRSRTWVLTRTAAGLRLKHDHRHVDGAEDAVTQYGGDTREPGTSMLQEFYADAHTASLIPAAARNVWTVSVEPGRRFAYALRREGTDRRFRVEFDLTAPVAPPPPPWGASGSTSALATPAADTVRVDGSPALAPLARALAEAYRMREPSAVVLVGGGLGSRERIEAVRDGRIGIALASQATASELASRGLTATEIAKSAVVFAVHAGVPLSLVATITATQLCDVYRGRITSWWQLDGPDLPIAARTRPPAEVDAAVVLAGVACFRDASVSTTARAIERPEEMAAELATVPGAFGMTSMPFVERSEGRIRALALDGVEPDAERVRRGQYPLVRSSYLVTVASPSAAVSRFLAFVRSDAGARVIRATGALPLP